MKRSLRHIDGVTCGHVRAERRLQLGWASASCFVACTVLWLVACKLQCIATNLISGAHPCHTENPRHKQRIGAPHCCVFHSDRSRLVCKNAPFLWVTQTTVGVVFSPVFTRVKVGLPVPGSADKLLSQELI